MREHYPSDSTTTKTAAAGLVLSTLLTVGGCRLDHNSSTSSTPPQNETSSETAFSPESHVRPIDATLAEKMQGVTLRDYPGCATADILRIVDVPYHNFNGANTMGSIVVRDALANEAGDIFEEIYATGFQIEHITPAEEVTHRRSQDPQVGVAIDNELMAKNITSGFNCRTLNGKPDKHGLGQAIDINPLQNPMITPNPFVTTDAPEYTYSPPEAEGAWNVETDPTRLLSSESKFGSQVIAIFKKHGWRWGGDFKTLYDGQHFDKTF